MQLVNKMTIRNMDTSMIIDEFVEMCVKKPIYSIGDIYLGYDQFQLAKQIKDLTTMQIGTKL